MATDLILPSGLAPSNLHLRDGVRARFVDGDLYNICERMREIDPSLYAVELDENDDCAYAIMEDCRDGVHRLIFRVKELDGRVLEKLQRIMAQPLDERLKELEALEYKWEEERKEQELESLYENVGRPMWTMLERCGFINSRGVSFAKRGVTGGRGSAGRS